MKKLHWTTVQKRVNDLIPQEINPRQISDKQMQALKKSLKTYNLVEIPAIDLDDKILAGHQRILALKLLGRGDELIDVRVPNRKLTEKEVQKYLITSNKVTGDWDYDLLKHFDFELLTDSGFEDMELMSFWDNDEEVTEDDFDVEAELAKITDPITKPGDILHLGRHKIICGDATDPEVVKKLCGDDRVAMIYSDPPYNISLDYDKGIGGKQSYGGHVRDNKTYDEYKNFIKDSLQAVLSVSKPDLHVFYYCDQVYIGLIQDVYRSLGIHNKRVALWLKNSQNPVPGAIFNKAYEPCVYGSIGKPFLNHVRTKNNEVLNKELGTGNELVEQVNHLFDVWTAKRVPGKEYQHATTKPLTLHEKPILRCTRPGDIIFDSFLGSGSTLLSAHKLGRTVYGCEREPRFCDLIRSRYEAMTGDKVTIERV